VVRGILVPAASVLEIFAPLPARIAHVLEIFVIEAKIFLFYTARRGFHIALLVWLICTVCLLLIYRERKTLLNAAWNSCCRCALFWSFSPLFLEWIGLVSEIFVLEEKIFVFYFAPQGFLTFVRLLCVELLFLQRSILTPQVLLWDGKCKQCVQVSGLAAKWLEQYAHVP
jgi:hypothetical protein